MAGVRKTYGAPGTYASLEASRHDASVKPDLRMSATVASCMAWTASENDVLSCSALSKASLKAL